MVTRISLVFVLGLPACAASEQPSPGPSTLGGSATAGDGDTETPTTGISAGTTSESPPSTTPTDTSTSQTVSSSDTGADESSSSGGVAASWRRYSLDTVAGTWSQVPLDELWVGANAPPSTGIAAAVSFTHFDRLLVVSDDGVVYEQADGVWQTPEPLARRFPMAGGLDVSAMAHTPSQDSEDYEDVFLVQTPVAVVYRQFENGGLELAQVSDLTDQDGGAPQGTVDNDWTLGIIDPTGLGTDPDWLVWYAAYANGDMWRFNAAFEWEQYPLADNPFFGVAAGEPEPLEVRAAYYDDTFEIAHFIAP